MTKYYVSYVCNTIDTNGFANGFFEADKLTEKEINNFIDYAKKTDEYTALTILNIIKLEE